MINYSEADLFLIEKYRNFLPKKVFDAHIHITKKPSAPDVPFDTQTPADYKRDMSPLLPGVEEIRLNMMPYPARQSHFRWQLAGLAGWRGLQGNVAGAGGYGKSDGLLSGSAVVKFGSDPN